MKKSIIKTAFIAVLTFLVCFFTKATETQTITYLSVITYCVLFITACFKSIKHRKREINTLINLVLCLIPFIFCYSTNNISYLFVPSYLLILYFDIIVNMKVYKRKLYLEEQKAIKRKLTFIRRRKEADAYNQSMRNLHHEKNGRQFYMADF